jgi:hypothetical protein
MAKFQAKTYYLFGSTGDLIDEFTGLAAAKEAGDEGGHAARWKKFSFARTHGGPMLTEYYGGSGNAYTIRDFMPENFPESRWSRRYRIRRYGRA